MMRLTATEVARNLSAVLGRVSRGEKVEVLRNGTPIAVITPPETRFLTGSELREMLRTLPAVDEDFARDIDELRRDTGPPEERWPS
jgi:prevent-host-death family protein